MLEESRTVRLAHSDDSLCGVVGRVVPNPELRLVPVGNYGCSSHGQAILGVGRRQGQDEEARGGPYPGRRLDHQGPY
jgi:hypothetical protein